MNELDVYKKAIDISTFALLLDHEENIIHANKNYCDAIGYPCNELIGKNPRIFNSGYHSKEFFEELRNTLNKGDVWQGKIRNKTKSGTNIWMDTAIFPFIPNGSDKVHYLAIRSDVSKQLEDVKSREQFLTNLTHEIRTPLHGVLSIIEMLSQSQLDAEQQEYIQIIKKASQSLYRLLNEALDVFKVGLGKVVLVESEFNLMEEIEYVLSLFKLKAKDKNIILKSNLDQQIPNLLIGDAYRFRQILINLIDNALKYTPKGSICINANVEQISQNECALRISVKDTGVGIEASRQEAIFEKFIQANADDYKEYGGVGVGLHVVKELLSLMKGNIKVISTIGEGSEFVISLTFQVATTKQKVLHEDLKTNSFSGLNILVADDSSINQMVFGKQLDRMGADYVMANNGKEALQLLKSVKFDLILLDIQMPIIDGFEFLTQLKQKSEYQNFRATPIIIVSAGNQEHIKHQFPELNIRGFLHKPYTSQRLSTILNEVLGNHASLERLNTNEQKSKTNVNLSYLQELADGDQTFIHDILHSFIVQSVVTVDLLKQQFKAKNYDEVKAIAHKFAPQLTFVGLDNQIPVLNYLELNADNPKEQELFEKQLDYLQEIIYEAVKELEILVNN